jgi:hypothetical protein
MSDACVESPSDQIDKACSVIHADSFSQLCLAIQRADQTAADAAAAVQIRQQLVEMSRRVDVALELLGEERDLTDSDGTRLHSISVATLMLQLA